MSCRRRSRILFGEAEAKDNMGSIMGASNVEHQPANTPATSNFFVHPTEDCNMSGRRPSQILFGEDEAKDNIGSIMGVCQSEAKLDLERLDTYISYSRLRGLTCRL